MAKFKSLVSAPSAAASISSTAVVGEPDWSPGVYEQCLDRIDRDGQPNQTSEAVVELTLEQRLEQLKALFPTLLGINDEVEDYKAPFRNFFAKMNGVYQHLLDQSVSMDVTLVQSLYEKIEELRSTVTDIYLERWPEHPNTVDHLPSDDLSIKLQSAITWKSQAEEVGSNAPAPSSGQQDINELLTDNLITSLVNGTAPWQRDDVPQWPKNGVTGKDFHGSNILRLMLAGKDDCRWATFQQAKQAGLSVAKGEHNTPIWFWKKVEKTIDSIDGDDPKKVFYPCLKKCSMFNYSQMREVPPNEDIRQAVFYDPIELFDNGNIQIEEGPTPGYVPSKDVIILPARDTFASDQHYMATTLHLLALWAAGQDRLGLEFGDSRQSMQYASVELRADIARTLLCAKFGVAPQAEGLPSYVGKQVELLSFDKKEASKATRDAEKMYYYVCALHPELRDEVEEDLATRQREIVAAGKDAEAPDEFFDATDLEFDLPEIALTHRPA